MDPPARVWRDWVLVAVLVPAAVLEGTLRPDLPWRALSLAIGVGLVLTLLWRRTKPFLMVVIGFGTGIIASIVTPGDPPQLSTTVYLLLLPYALTRWGEGRAVPAGLAIVVTADVLAVFVDPVSVSDAAGGLVVLVATAAVGTAFRYRARARAREFERVKLVERERLARDLHDTVAHHVSAIAIRAQAGLATAATTPEAATEALRVIEAEAKRTLTEMRTMVRVLRRDKPTDRAPEARAPETRALEDRVVEDRTLEDRVPERVSRAASPPASRTRFGRRPAADAAGAPDQERALAAAAQDWPPLPQADDLAPNPGIVDIRRLAEENRAGPPITVRIAGDVDEIPPPVAAAIYRIAQESVTNARRHARDATSIEVQVAADKDGVRLRVRDDGDTNGTHLGPNAGYGLLGMRERVHLLGGTFEAGPDPRPTRGWTVTAVLPRAGQGAPA